MCIKIHNVKCCNREERLQTNYTTKDGKCQMLLETWIAAILIIFIVVSGLISALASIVYGDRCERYQKTINELQEERADMIEEIYKLKFRVVQQKIEEKK